MTDQARVVRQQALTLPPYERADLAADLIASLDEEHDDPELVEQLWARELERRARQALAAASKTEDWSTVRDRTRSRIAHG